MWLFGQFLVILNDLFSLLRPRFRASVRDFFVNSPMTALCLCFSQLWCSLGSQWDGKPACSWSLMFCWQVAILGIPTSRRITLTSLCLPATWTWCGWLRHSPPGKCFILFTGIYLGLPQFSSRIQSKHLNTELLDGAPQQGLALNAASLMHFQLMLPCCWLHCCIQEITSQEKSCF